MISFSFTFISSAYFFQLIWKKINFHFVHIEFNNFWTISSIVRNYRMKLVFQTSSTIYLRSLIFWKGVNKNYCSLYFFAFESVFMVLLKFSELAFSIYNARGNRYPYKRKGALKINSTNWRCTCQHFSSPCKFLWHWLYFFNNFTQFCTFICWVT